MLTYGIPPEFLGGVHYETAIRHRVSPEFIGSRNCVPMAFTAESPPAWASKPQGSAERVLPWQITMDQLIFASLSHTHYWCEVGMLKVPAVKCLDMMRVSRPRQKFVHRVEIIFVGSGEEGSFCDDDGFSVASLPSRC